MRTLKLVVYSFALILMLYSCSPDNSAPIAGKGGNATLTLNLKHHGVGHNLINSKVYVKYNAQDVPSNRLYDDSLTAIEDASDTLQIAVFSGLKNGNYYFYGTGYDTSIFKPVYGGIPFKITLQSTQAYDLPVSED